MVYFGNVAFSKSTRPSRSTVAYIFLIGLVTTAGTGAVGFTVGAVPGADVDADIKAPAGASAISLTSRPDSDSVVLPPLDWIRICAGPWNRRNSLSPVMLRRNQVLMENKTLEVNVQGVDARRVLKKRVSGSKDDREGICKLRVLDLKRKGCGALRITA